MAAQPYLDVLEVLRDDRDAAIKAVDLLVGVSDSAYYAQLQKAIRLGRQVLVAKRDYHEALTFGRPLTRQERRRAIRLERKAARGTE